MAALLFHLLLLAIDSLGLYRSRRAEDSAVVATAFAAVLQTTIFAFLLAFSFGVGLGKLRLLAYGLFIHCPLVTAGLALLLRRRRPRLAMAFAATTLGILALAAQAFLVEPRWLEVTNLELETSKVREPLLIAVVSDLQTDRVGAYEERVLETVMSRKPDLILMTGDYIQEEDDAQRRILQDKLAALLRELGFQAPLGVIAVRGDVDGLGWEEALAGSPITIVHRSQILDLGPLRIAALEPQSARNPGLTAPPSDRFFIVMGHSPDFALGTMDTVDLLVAGHTHGGQVRLPFIGPLLTFSRVPRSWAAGVTKLESGATLVVSRGIGMERGWAPRLRFLCRPQLVFIELRPSSLDAGP